MDDQMDDQINFDKAFSDMAEQVAVMNRECNRLQAALDRAEADKAAAVGAMREAAIDAIRAITTPPALPASPEVQTLVAALSGMLAIWEKTYYVAYAQHVRNADIEKHSHVMRAALAPFTAVKP